MSVIRTSVRICKKKVNISSVAQMKCPHVKNVTKNIDDIQINSRTAVTQLRQQVAAEGSGSYLALPAHAAGEEEVGDGGESQAARGHQQTQPPRPHPAGVVWGQLLVGR